MGGFFIVVIGLAAFPECLDDLDARHQFHHGRRDACQIVVHLRRFRSHVFHGGAIKHHIKRDCCNTDKCQTPVDDEHKDQQYRRREDTVDQVDRSVGDYRVYRLSVILDGVSDLT